MRVAQEEIFGPVQVAIPFDTKEEAVRLANSTDYGLVASVHTRDTERAQRVGRQIEASLVFVNHYDRAGIGNPFGGTKWSGYGREHALQTLGEFGYTRTLRLPSGDGQPRRWNGAVDAVQAADPTEAGAS